VSEHGEPRAALLSTKFGAQDIAPPLLPADDAGKGFAGFVEFGEGIKLQASGLAYPAILAGKRETAKQVRPDFEPVKPRLLLRRQTVSPTRQPRVWVHGLMLPTGTIQGERKGLISTIDGNPVFLTVDALGEISGWGLPLVGLKPLQGRKIEMRPNRTEQAPSDALASLSLRRCGENV
jgi:hypothetical protein